MTLKITANPPGTIGQFMALHFPRLTSIRKHLADPADLSMDRKWIHPCEQRILTTYPLTDTFGLCFSLL